MLAPIRPRPIIPSCIGLSVAIWSAVLCPWGGGATLPGCLGVLPHGAIAPDEGVGGGVVSERGLVVGGELGNDPRGEHLAELHSPLVEGVDSPDRALCE